MLVCRNLIVVVISVRDYSEINDSDFVCRCIHSIRLNLLLCAVNVQMFALVKLLSADISSMQLAQC